MRSFDILLLLARTNCSTVSLPVIWNAMNILGNNYNGLVWNCSQLIVGLPADLLPDSTKPEPGPILKQFNDVHMRHYKPRWNAYIFHEICQWKYYSLFCYGFAWLFKIQIRHVCLTGTRALLQNSIRRLIASSHEVSKPQDLYLRLTDRSEIWQPPRQQNHRGGFKFQSVAII